MCISSLLYYRKKQMRKEEEDMMRKMNDISRQFSGFFFLGLNIIRKVK